MAVRHFFAGVNSPMGFFSRFDGIASDKTCARKIYIKGGPGMGKSTIMKRIAHIAEAEGYDVEVFHCSSDSNSLDGLYVKELKTALIDATAPHNSDPVYPGVTGEIFNCADFLNSGRVKDNAEEIIHFSEYKKLSFEKAYNYLRAAGHILDNIAGDYKNTMYLHGIDLESEKLIRRYLPEITMPKKGNLRALFVSAVTADGFENYMDTVFKGKNVIGVRGGYGTGILLKRIMDASIVRGFDVEAFYCPMAPCDKLEHIVISDLKIAFTTYNHYHHYISGDIVDLDEYITQIPLETDGEYAISETLLKKAAGALAEARAAHSFMEGFYTPAMDFAALGEKTNALIESIFI